MDRDDGSALQDLSPKELKRMVTGTKAALAAFTSYKGAKELTGEAKEAYNKAFTALSALNDALSAALNAKSAVKMKEPKKE